VMLEKLHLQFSLFVAFFFCHSSRINLYCVLCLRYWVTDVNARRSFFYFERKIELTKSGLQGQYVLSWLGL